MADDRLVELANALLVAWRTRAVRQDRQKLRRATA
jgi:hypothetical protein